MINLFLFFCILKEIKPWLYLFYHNLYGNHHLYKMEKKHSLLFPKTKIIIELNKIFETKINNLKKAENCKISQLYLAI